jgi:hypothetical protein
VLLVAPYREANRSFHRPFAEVLALTPRPAAWLASAPQGVWAGWLLSEAPGESAELSLFPGFVPLALVGLAAGAVMWRPALGGRRALVTACLVTAGLLAALASRWGDWSPWHAVYRWVPGGEAIRAVGRVVFTVELFALVGALVALEGLLQRCSLSWRAAFGWALLVAGIVEQMPVRELPSFELAPWQARVAALRERMTTGTVAYVELPPGRPFWQGQLQAMWAGLEANVPVVNGYSGRYPTGYPDWTRTMTDAELHDWLAGRADSRPVVKLSGD